MIDPRASRPIYVQIMDEVRRLVVLGELRPDDALPSVRQLAAELKLNHNTIVQAYRELEREEVVYVRRGQGTFIAAQPAPQRDRVLAEVAERALSDAHRHGIAVDELVTALRAAETKIKEANNG
ncbi:MAG: GntR family transcriptional regulator [Sphingomonadales bacterium]|nr:MAG: GntR family transcriptional regulator [Sphingomonadales bacterium]